MFSLLALVLSLSLGSRDYEVRRVSKARLSNPIVSLAVSCVTYYHPETEVRRYTPNRAFLEFCQIVRYHRGDANHQVPIDAMATYKLISTEEASQLISGSCLITVDYQYIAVPRYLTRPRLAARFLLPTVCIR